MLALFFSSVIDYYISCNISESYDQSPVKISVIRGAY